MQPASPEDKLRIWYLPAGAGRSRFSLLHAPGCSPSFFSSTSAGACLTGAHAHLAESVWISDSVRQSLISVAEKTLLSPESRASRSTTCLQATTDTSDQTGASLPCCPLKLFSPDSEPARMKHRTRYRRGPSTNDI